MAGSLGTVLIALVVSTTRLSPEPIEAPPRAMTFTQAVEAGLAYHVDVSVAECDVARARALRRQALGTMLPSLSANGVLSRIDHARELAGRQLQPQSQFNGNVNLTLPVVAPRAWGNVAEASGETQVARAQANVARREVAVAVAITYLDAIAQAQALNVLAHSVATNRSHAHYARTRFEGGVGNRLDMLHAEQEWATSAALCRGALVELVEAKERLGTLTGYNGPVEPVDEVMLPPAFTGPEALAALTQRRADVQASLTALVQASRVRENTWLDFLPNLLATGSLFGQTPPSPTSPHFGWQVQLLLNVPLYDGGIRYGRLHERHVQENRAALVLDDRARRARSEMRVALATAQAAELSLVDAQRAAAQAAQALQLATQAYKKGLSRSLDVIDAERRARDTATQAVAAQNALRRSQVQLVAASGQFPGPV